MRGKARGCHNPLRTGGITPAYAGKRRGRHGTPTVPRDHPRVCGEKLGQVGDLTAQIRITPAYAGKSQTVLDLFGGSGDHPRVCGEKALKIVSGIETSGSPPRMRGKEHVHPLHAVVVGITPAYAGKRVERSQAGKDHRDHPRVCGEKSHQRGLCLLLLGSPPRMRGKATFARLLCRPWRITPAYAGKSGRWPRALYMTWDHPRVCGEKTKKIP